MLVCQRCNNEQSEGKFCGACGGALYEQGQGTISEASSTPAGGDIALDKTNESIERVKETSKVFGKFFKQHIQRPSLIFNNKVSEFKNGLISILVTIALLSLATYFLLNNFLGASGNISLISTFLNFFLILAINIAIPISLMYLMDKFFGLRQSMKDMISIFGAHLSLVLILGTLALVFTILQSNGFSILLIFTALAIMTTLLPLYLISGFVSQNKETIDPFYSYLIYIVAQFIGAVIVYAIIIDSAMGQMLSKLMWYL